jgi:putative FmdB family regulatory protein
MPVYEYACVECGHHFEQYRKVTDRPPRRCPECRGRVRKVFRPVGIIFKGSGFHVNDYRKPEKKEAAGSASSKDKGSD